MLMTISIPMVENNSPRKTGDLDALTVLRRPMLLQATGLQASQSTDKLEKFKSQSSFHQDHPVKCEHSKSMESTTTSLRNKNKPTYLFQLRIRVDDDDLPLPSI